MKKHNKKLVILFTCLITLSACSSKGNEDVVFQTNQENEEVLQQSEEFSQQISSETDSTNFVPDYDNVNEINFTGNTAANLGNHGNVTNQGKWTYYYNKNEIKKINTGGECLYVCTAPGARSLNVVGDWIYYYYDTSIYRVHTDGSNQEALISNEVASLIFYVIDNNIYYVNKKAVSATSSEYSLQVYNLETESTISMGSIANADNFVGFNGYSSDYIYFKCRYLIDRSTNYFKYKEFKIDLKNGQIVCLNEEAEPHGVAYVENDILYKNGLIRTDAINYITINNVYNGRIFESGVIIGDDYKLWYINGNDYIEGAEPENIRHQIISESKYMNYICIVDDYVYYRIDSYDCDTSSLYRVKIDGTAWEELP